jgi:hypothetical protein
MIIPAAFADDTDRLARFQREAQVLASLNHPNIAHISFWRTTMSARMDSNSSSSCRHSGARRMHRLPWS